MMCHVGCNPLVLYLMTWKRNFIFFVYSLSSDPIPIFTFVATSMLWDDRKEHPILRQWNEIIIILVEIVTKEYLFLS